MNTSLNESEDYEDADYENSQFWDNFLQAIRPVLDNQSHVKFFIATIGVFVNIFHLIVLTRKSLRVYTINLFMIGIAICDFTRLLSDVLGALPDYYVLYQVLSMPRNCIPPKTYLVFFVEIYSITLSVITQKLAVWFGVTMAVLRVFIIKYPLSRRIQDLLNTEYGIRILLIVCLPHIPFWVVDFKMDDIFEYNVWVSPPSCTNLPGNTSRTRYIVEPGEYDNEIMLKVEGYLFTVFPSVVLLITAGVLIYFLRTMRKPSSSSSYENNDRSTKMVVLVTVTFLISTTPLGIIYFLPIAELDYGSTIIINLISMSCEFVSLLNGILHFLLCALISSQYQTTVREMFVRKKKRITTTLI